MYRTAKKGPARIEANLTSFIDVTFLLIIFFILVAQLSSAERPNLPLPQIENRVSQALPRGDRLIINCTAGSNGAIYTVGSQTFQGGAGLRGLANVIQRWRAAEAKAPVAVRAERTLAYQNVQPLLDLLRKQHAAAVELIIIPPQEQAY